jgi:hypothetical protein
VKYQQATCRGCGGCRGWIARLSCRRWRPRAIPSSKLPHARTQRFDPVVVARRPLRSRASAAPCQTMTAPAMTMSAMLIRNWTGGGGGSGLEKGATCARAGVQDIANKEISVAADEDLRTMASCPRQRRFGPAFARKSGRPRARQPTQNSDRRDPDSGWRCALSSRAVLLPCIVVVPIQSRPGDYGGRRIAAVIRPTGGSRPLGTRIEPGQGGAEPPSSRYRPTSAALSRRPRARLLHPTDPADFEPHISSRAPRGGPSASGGGDGRTDPHRLGACGGPGRPSGRRGLSLLPLGSLSPRPSERRSALARHLQCL